MTLYIKLAIAAIIFLAGLATGIKFESGEIAKMKAAQQAALVVAVEEARTQEQARFKGVQDAQAAAAKQAQVSKRAADAARSESRSLRDDLDAAREAASQSLAACNQHSTTVGRLLDQCAGEYQSMAETAQGHANDVSLLLSAWPK